MSGYLSLKAVTRVCTMSGGWVRYQVTVPDGASDAGGALGAPLSGEPLGDVHALAARASSRKIDPNLAAVLTSVSLSGCPGLRKAAA
jgi:hypothetical protein